MNCLRSNIRRTLAVVIAVLGCAPAGRVQAWDIARFAADVLVQTNASLDVAEIIVVDFGSETHRGIYRSIPTWYRDQWGEPHRIRLQVRAVTDGQNQPLEFAELVTDRYDRIRIGSANVAVTGLETYRVRYQVERAVRFLDHYDELYWNATGNEWPVQIHQTKAVLRLALPPGPNKVKAFGFTRAFGATTGEATVVPDDRGASYETRGILRPMEGLTIVAAWPKGMVVPPSNIRKLGWWIADHPAPAAILGIAVILLAAWLLSLRRSHRDTSPPPAA